MLSKKKEKSALLSVPRDIGGKIPHYNFFEKNRRGTILVENIIFIVLNLVFLTILFLFLFSKMGSAAVLEERYAKQIALLIDSAKPGMDVRLNMEDAVEKANDENWEGKIVSIQNNLVTVQLREKGGYSYSFFNNVELSKEYHYARDGENYEFKIEGYKQNEIK